MGTLPANVLDKSLQQLERTKWQKPQPTDTYLVGECLRLVSVPLRQLRPGDLRMLILQNIGLKYLVPLALERLRKKPLTDGTYYAGDLLNAVLNSEPQFWREHPKWRDEVREIAKRTVGNMRVRNLRKPASEEPVVTTLTESLHQFDSATR